MKRRSPPITLFRNPAPPFKQSDPDLLGGIHWGSLGGEKPTQFCCWDRESQAVRGLAVVRGWGLGRGGVGIFEAHPDENYRQAGAEYSAAKGVWLAGGQP